MLKILIFLIHKKLTFLEQKCNLNLKNYDLKIFREISLKKYEYILKLKI